MGETRNKHMLGDVIKKYKPLRGHSSTVLDMIVREGCDKQDELYPET